MSKSHNHQKGFATVEAVLVLVILILIGVVGWMVYKNHHKSTSSTTSSHSTTSSSNTSTSSSTQTTVSAADVTQLATDFYNQYKACTDTTCKTNLVKQDGTANLLSYYQPSNGSYAEDPILCAQDVPNSVSVSGVSAAATSGSGSVTENFDSGPTTVKFTAVQQSSGDLKVDTVTCNPPLTPSTTPN
jgi:cytoskeletal protein RodZ